VKFVALDVETSNPDMASICQIGIVHFEDGKVVDSWSSLVNPRDYFDDMNVSIHGIEEDDVRGAPDFKQASAEVLRRLSGQVVAIHTAFDRNAIARASLRHAAELPDCVWLNTASVARRAWPEVAQRGYGLKPLAEKFGITFEHHNAVEDARAAGLILLRAIDEAKLDLDAWIERIKRPIGTDDSGRMARDGNPEGALFGEIVVFTGSLAIPRREASEMAAKAGCEVADGVTKHTTLLVVGDQDIRALNGHEKSSKHRKAEELMAKGLPIRILTESDFASMVGLR
jgi:DNA polymerase-3 subunit epsilon